MRRIAARSARVFAILRAFKVHALILGSAVPILFAAWFDGPIRIPGRDVKDLAVPMAPLSLYFATLAARSAFSYIDEVRHPNRGRRRTIFAGTVLVLATIAGLVSGVISASVGASVLVRNGTLYAALGLATPFGAESTMSVTLVTYSALAWMIGSEGAHRPAAPWAIPMLPEDSVLGFAVVAVVAVSGTVIWLVGERTRRS